MTEQECLAALHEHFLDEGHKCTYVCRDGRRNFESYIKIRKPTNYIIIGCRFEVGRLCIRFLSMDAVELEKYTSDWTAMSLFSHSQANILDAADPNSIQKLTAAL